MISRHVSHAIVHTQKPFAKLKLNTIVGERLLDYVAWPFPLFAVLTCIYIYINLRLCIYNYIVSNISSVEKLLSHMVNETLNIFFYLFSCLHF